MFVRARRVGARRYAYLVEGVREGKRVKQKTLLYLGPIWKLAAGPIPDTIKSKAEKRFKVDWNRVSRDLARIPLTFEELALARQKRYAISVMTRQAGPRSRGNLPRARGELSALSRIATTRFNQMFERVGDTRYRLRADRVA